MDQICVQVSLCLPILVCLHNLPPSGIIFEKGYEAMQVDIYMPRLDITFKKGPIPKERGTIPEIREHWKKFCFLLRLTYIENGHNARLIEVPLWQITQDLVRKTSVNADIIFIPHKMRLNWFLDHRVRYYMQMVLPNIFSIDEQGWCASAKVWPITINHLSDDSIFCKLNARIKNNISKFKQPALNNKAIPERFILFPCQIPHDETIKYHSDIGVEQALEALIHGVIKKSSLTLIIKGHPANQQAMATLKKIYLYYKDKLDFSYSSRLLWIDNISIHQLLSRCLAVATVNSGVGLEAILHGRYVATFGDADYASISYKLIYGGNVENASEAVCAWLSSIDTSSIDENYLEKCQKFMHSWYSCHYDCDVPETFVKVLQG